MSIPKTGPQGVEWIVRVHNLRSQSLVFCIRFKLILRFHKNICNVKSCYRVGWGRYVATASEWKTTYQYCTCNPWSSKPITSYDPTRLQHEPETCPNHPFSQGLLQPQQVPSLSPGDQSHKHGVMNTTQGGWGWPHVPAGTSLCWHYHT